MDWRVKSFEPEVRAAFAFLIERGFTVDVEPMADNQRRPAGATVRFRAPDTLIETSLVLGFAGEDSVQTTMLTVTGSFHFGPAVAHKGHEVKKALLAQAQSVRDALQSMT